MGTPYTLAQVQDSLLREEVAAFIRAAIAEVRLRPGERVVERQLAQRLGVSRATVRGALLQLAAEGLVRTTPPKGAVVVAPTRREAEEFHEIRATPAGLATRQFVLRATVAQRRELRNLVAALAQAVEMSGGASTLLDVRHRFYQTLLRGAGSRPLQEMLTGLQARVTALCATSRSIPDRRRATVEQMWSIVDAIDPLAAERAAFTHVWSTAVAAFSLLTPSDAVEALR